METDPSPPAVALDYAAPPAPPASPTRACRVRTIAALTLAAPLGLLGGYGLSYAGFGIFPAWFFLSLALPITLCLLTCSRELLVALLGSGMMMGYLLALQFWQPPGARPMSSSERLGVLGFLGGMAVISMALSCGIGMMMARWRRERRERRGSAGLRGQMRSCGPCRR